VGLLPLRVAIEIVVDLSSAIGGRLVQFFGRNIRGQGRGPFPERRRGLLENDTAGLDFSLDLGTGRNSCRAAQLGGQRHRASGVRFQDRGHDAAPSLVNR
jgi:hypothetical protein